MSRTRVNSYFLALFLLTLIRLPTVQSHAQEPAPMGEIVFASVRDGNTDIYRMAGDGTNIRRLTDHASVDTNPTWSPDGTLIAFQSYRDGNSNIYVMNAEGTQQKRVTELSGDEFDPSWSADSQTIIFASERNAEGTQTELFAVRVDGTALLELTDFNAFVRAPAWSPDGNWIAFTSNMRGSTADQFHIFLMRKDGFAVKQLTSTETGSDSDPEWSPDSQFIVFASTRDGDSEIYVIRADGSSAEVERLTDNGAEDGKPVFSADGSQIGFLSDRDGLPQIYRMMRDGSQVERLTNSEADDLMLDCSWTP